jgi:hypothetical protein
MVEAGTAVEVAVAVFTVEAGEASTAVAGVCAQVAHPAVADLFRPLHPGLWGREALPHLVNDLVTPLPVGREMVFRAPAVTLQAGTGA